MAELVVRNATRGFVLAERARVAKTFLSRGVGLLGAKNAGGGLFIEPCSSVHTMFMRFAIDVIFLDPGDAVLAVYAPLAPWRATAWVRGAKRVLELDAGGAKGTQVGDRLECEPCG
ncbi:hypothetical protein LBMAG42_41140 [Deltaproteobacteria bacterium]|nr:hypothetical protein LBMAG42_41140 [Deltaproteobacteria bacterium]